MTTPAKLINKLSRSRLHEEIVTLIQGQILRGEIKPGDKLPTERDLAESLNVNRSTVREALRKLESQELIDIRHGDGAYARDFTESGSLDLIKAIIYMNDELDPKVMLDLLVFRRIFVPEMAAIAAQTRTEADIRLLEETMHAPLSVLDRDMRIHQLIAKASHNIIYTIILNFFNKLFCDFGYLYFDRPENQERSNAFHQDIVAAIKNGDENGARNIMSEVLGYAENQIRDYISASSPTIKGRKKPKSKK